MIEMKDVFKKYPNGVMAVNGINVKIDQGEFVYVVGPSGAGKSTFIKMMYREEKPTKGSIVINGMDLAKLKEKKVPLLRRN
ncbi:ATP-binding cassette domain-containing protein, partial [Aeromonas veronii]|nr:ATP-binding cassette domain-containing protein [Aeromonas veronii]